MLIVQQLARIAKAEGVEVEEAALQAIARGCDGGMRDAESALDQLISFCGGKIVEADVLSMYGLAAQSQLLSMAGAILAGDAVQAMRELDAAAQAGKDLARLVGDLLRHFRNLLIYQVSQGDRSLLEVSEAEWEAMKPQLAGVTTETLTRIMEVLSECELQLREAASRKILIELALWKACQARQAVSLEAVLQQLQRLRTEAAAGGASEAPAAAAAPPAGSLRAAVEAQTGRASRPAPAAAPANPPSGAPPPQARAANEPVAETALQELWGRLLAEMREQRPMLYSTFALAFPVSFERGDLVIGFAPDNKANMVLASGDAHRAWLVQRLAALGWPDVRLKFVEASPPAAPAPAVTASAPAEAGASAAAPAAAPKGAPKSLNDFKNDPEIARALELFRGVLRQVVHPSGNT
jgi:DNA polymerase-3 subunit gamma/tau